MDLSNIQSADIQRIDEDNQVRVEITLNLIVGLPWKTPGGFYISPADLAEFKTGTPAQKAVIRKKYIRRAIQNYLDARPLAPTITDQGIQNVAKAAFTEAGDI